LRVSLALHDSTTWPQANLRLDYLLYKGDWNVGTFWVGEDQALSLLGLTIFVDDVRPCW
jgi:hypothetical protein